MWSHYSVPLPGNRRQKKQRALWCYNARSVTNHIADFLLLIL